MEWTKEQEQVIKLRNRNILVSAAAGSGKTAVLVERIIKKITDESNPVDIDKLLVVTFTKAAAAEMRERIGNAIEKLLVERPGDENLINQQTLLHNAQITTIDSFCLFVVRNHFEEIGLEPNFRIADEGEIKLLEKDVLDAVFEKEYARHSQMFEGNVAGNTVEDRFLEFVDAYSDNRSDKNVKDMISKIYKMSASNPWPIEWVHSLIRPYIIETKDELLETELIKGVVAHVKELLLDIPNRLEALRQIALTDPEAKKIVTKLSEDIEKFEEVKDIEDFEPLSDFCKNIGKKMGNFPNTKGYKGDVQKKDTIKDRRSGIKDEIDDLCKNYFSMSTEDLVEQLQRVRSIAEEVIRLTLLYMEAMEEKKRQKHIMDFSDIEHAALHILVDEKTKEHSLTAMEFKHQFEEIMIDEYQDSNQVQEEILCAISKESFGEYNMFMVGDVKQSIYRFRMARPELFMEKFATYDLNDSNKQRIDLHMNFRSRKEVLDFTNDMFYKIMAMDIGNVAYDADAALHYGGLYDKKKDSDGVELPESEEHTGDMKAEVLLYETKIEQEDDENVISSEEFTKRQLEARMIAQRIHELKETMKIKEKDKDTGEEKLRPLRNRDIVILLRGLKEWGNEFSSVLEDCGIPAHVSTSTGYFSAIEVQTVLSLLKILDNPYQDIPMAAVLKSAMVGLDNEELAEISTSEEGASFAEKAMYQMENATEGKLYNFYQCYKSLREKVMDTPIHQLLNTALEKSGYADYVKALPAGSKRKANLDMLIEKAIAYEKTSYKGLFHFVRYIDQLQEYSVDFGEAEVIGENEDVVRIMTIHKSKGLEFPVVFVAGISKKFNKKDSQGVLVIHPDVGLGFNEMQISPKVKIKNAIHNAIADCVKQDNLGEELRVLYVALTRAREKLILTGTIENRDKFYESYTGNTCQGEPISFTQRINAKSYLHWIAPAVMSYPGKYEFTFKNENDLVMDTAKNLAQKKIEKDLLIQEIENADNSLVEEYKAKFAYEYPFKQDEKRKSKYSVSELKHDSMVENYDREEGEVEVPDFLLEEREPYIPEFAQTKEETGAITESGEHKGALYGTAVHRVMECMDFAAFLEVDQTSKQAVLDYINSQLDAMVPNLLSQEQRDLIRPSKLMEFFQSSIATRMAEAEKRGDLFREKPFVMDYNGVLLQGIIDVFWIENDRIVLLDYKTDRVDKAEELVQRYQKQLELYAQALCRIFSSETRKIDSTENLIYSFRLDEVVSL